MSRGTVFRLLVATIVLGTLMAVPIASYDWFGINASREADDIDTLMDVMIIISSYVMAVVVVAMGYAMWKFQAKPGDESDGKPIHGNTRLEIVWTVIPTIIVLAAAAYSWIILDDIEAKEPDAMKVEVIAQQFAWRFDYPDQGVTSTELHVPVGRQLDIHLTALDVLHAFWVPEWRIKRDLVPAGPGGDEIDRDVQVTPDREGTYSVVCTELCGFGHTTMRAAAVVESQEEFDAWVSAQKPIPAKGKVSTGEAGGIGAGVYDRIEDS